MVQLADPETNKLGPPTPLRSILSTLNLEENYVILKSQDPPVVKIGSIADDKARYSEWKEFKKQQKGLPKGFDDKEIQITWTSAPADLAHRIKHAKELLQKGHKVALILAPKPKDRAPEEMVKRQLESSIEKEFEDITRTWMPTERTKKLTKYFLRPK